MDDEVDRADGNVNSILAQDSSELFEILCSQSQSVIMSLWETAPPGSGLQTPGGPAAASEHIRAMLEHFRDGSAADCCSFLQRVCMLCENMPMHLELRLLSVAGSSFSGQENSTLCVTNQKPSPEEQLIKRPRIDHWQQHLKAAAGVLQRRWQRRSEGLLRDVQPEKVWVSLRTANRTRDRPDQTPGPAERGNRTPEPDVDYGSLESRLTLEAFLQGCAGKVTVLCGPAGSGKTLLTSCLGHQWANGLGPIPSSYLFVLLEFRQLNLLSSPLSLAELLFQHYFPPQNDDNHKAVMDYLVSNPEQSCWLLDGYDEFHGKLNTQNQPLDSETPVPAADLLSGLLNRQLLPGSTVLLTCRLRDLPDLDGLTDKVGQLLPWDHQEIREYVHSFFGVKDGSLGSEAADLLFSSRHLLAMSSFPALCNICCVFLQHLLQEKGHEVPATLTQLYLAVVAAFLSRWPHGGEDDRTNTSTFPQSSVPALSQLSRLALEGLEKGNILFWEDDVPANVFELSVRTGLFSQVEVRGHDGKLVSAYSFTHLTVQEFLAALRIMTSNDVSDTQLKKRFSLKTRWTTKSDQKTVFTDSLYLYVCGLASPRCTQAVVQVAQASGLKGFQNWVLERQDLVLKLLKSLCLSNSLTGPKVLQLCHYVQESQNQQLAHQVLSVRPTLELRNIWLLPDDIHALAFVVNAAGDTGVGLDFGSCSMELECLEVLTRCQNIHYLSFRSRKYGDKFAGKLAAILPEFTALRKLEFWGAALTAAGAASVASALRRCPTVTELNFSDNNLQDEGIQHMAEVFTELQNLVSVTEDSSVEGLVKKMSSCLNIQRVHAEYDPTHTHTHTHIIHDTSKTEAFICLLNQKWSSSDMKTLAESLSNCPALSVLNLSGGQWDEETLKTLTEFVPKFSVTEKIVLNGSCSSLEGLVVLTALLSDCLSVAELHVRYRTAVILLCTSSTLILKTRVALTELHLSDIKLYFVVFYRINSSSLLPSDVTKICKKLVQCRFFLELEFSHCSFAEKTMEKLIQELPKMSLLQRLNLSGNQLEDEGVKCLLDSLPRLHISSYMNLSKNRLTQRGLLDVVSTLSTCARVSQVDISLGEAQRCLIWFRQNGGGEQTLRVSSSNLELHHLLRLAEILSKCPSLTRLQLKNNSLQSEWIQNFVKVLTCGGRGRAVSVEESWIGSEEAVTLLRPSALTLILLSGHLISDAAAQSLSDLLPRLRSLNLARCVWSAEGGRRLIGALNQAGRLEDLCLDAAAQLDRNSWTCLAQALRNLTSVRSLKLNEIVKTSEEDGVLDVLAGLEGLTQIKEIELDGWRMADQGIKQLIKFLPSWKELRKISLSKNLISDPSGEKLLDALRSCFHLEELHLSSNRLGDVSAARMALILPSMTHLSVLDISENQITKEGAISLSAAIMSLKKLKRIHLTSVGTSELSAVVASLGHCAFIQDVGLGWNNCGDDVALQLTEVLPFCPRLTRIDLECNRVSAVGVEKLVGALRSCPALQIIRLWRNRVSAGEAHSFSLREVRLNFSSTIM
uniref:Protein NLRC5-like n=1 Tax=Kryptolebias marmoratus TaxID=37003 RepID=A0A3Q3BA05_KRYMA